MGRAISKTIDQKYAVQQKFPRFSDAELAGFVVATAVNELAFTLEEALKPRVEHTGVPMEPTLDPPEDSYFDIVFDGFPGPEGSRFVEVEDADGKSFKLGDWMRREDGQCVLRVPLPL